MAKHEMHKMHEKAEHHAKGGAHHEEHEKKEHGGRVKRAKGGKIEDDLEKEVDRGHKKVHVTRKRGGMVEGKEPKARMDRRARGGRTSEDNPMTKAGQMTNPKFIGKDGPEESGSDVGGD